MQETEEARVQSLGGEGLLEEGMVPPQYACLENPMDRGAWWATAHRVTHSQTPLKRLSTHMNKVFFFSFTPAQDTHYACHNSIVTVQSDSLKAPYYFHKFSLLGGSL